NLANHVHGDHLLLPTAAKSSRVGKTPGSVLDRHHTKKWLSFRSASTVGQVLSEDWSVWVV
ncbi:hypothetical protein, partial [Acidovorax sp.]|uniref:hypothetical protein n=1 Tax=Acidovorax sp. TaxID=1872122 RepID=UPI0025B9819F